MANPFSDPNDPTLYGPGQSDTNVLPGMPGSSGGTFPINPTQVPTEPIEPNGPTRITIPRSPPDKSAIVPVDIPPQPDAAAASGGNPTVVPGASDPGDAAPTNDDLDAILGSGAVTNAQGASAGTDQNASQPSQTPGQEAPSPAPTNDDLDHILAQGVHGNMAVEDPGMGPVIGIAAGINHTLENIVMPFLKGGAEEGMQQVTNAAYREGMPDVGKAMQTAGEAMIKDPSGVQREVDSLLKGLGAANYYDNSYLNAAGRDALPMLIGIGAMVRGSAYMAQKAVDVSGPIVQSLPQQAIKIYGQAIQSNPMLWLTHEIASAMGSDVLERKATNYAQRNNLGVLGQVGASMLGALSGGLAGTGGVSMTTKLLGSRVAKVAASVPLATMRWLAQGIDNAMDFIGAQKWSGMVRGADGTLSTPSGTKLYEPLAPTVNAATGKRAPPPPFVHPIDLEDAREKETLARDASDKVTETRVYRDQQAPSSVERANGEAAMRTAIANEKLAHDAADRAWNKLPKAVRGNYSRDQQALRAQWAQTEFPQKFAQDQVSGALAMVDAQVDHAIASVEPSDVFGVGPTSKAVRDAIWKARDIAKGQMEKFWNRVRTDRPMPNKAIVTDVNNFAKNEAVRGPEEKIVSQHIQTILDAFGDIKEPPKSLEWVKTEISRIHRDASAAYRARDAQTGAALSRLEKTLYGTVSTAFPENEALKQARAASVHYYDLFNRSDVGPLLRENADYGDVIRVERTMKYLMKSVEGLPDVAAIVGHLKGKGVTNVSAPDYTTKAAKAAAASLEQATENGIKAELQKNIAKVERDPIKVTRILGDPNFQAKIKSFSKVSAQVQAAFQQMSSLVTARRGIEDSALAKYIGGDVDKAFDKVWKSNNPAAMAKALIKGTVGVGGFEQDPMALQGWRAKVLDKFEETTKGDPIAMRRALAGPSGRLLKASLSSNGWERLNSIVDRITNEMQNRAAGAKARGFKTMVAQLMALKAWHFLPEFLHAGEGGSLKEASLVAGFAKETVEGLTHNIPPNEMLSRMISDPAYERTFLMKPPGNLVEANELKQSMTSIIAFERAAYSFYQNWTAYGIGPGPTDEKAQDSSPLSGIEPSQEDT